MPKIELFSAIICRAITSTSFPKGGFPVGFDVGARHVNMRQNFFLSFSFALLLLGLFVQMNRVTAAVPDDLRTKLDKVGSLFAERQRLVEQGEAEVLREMRTTTDREQELRLRNRHEEILGEITNIDKSRLRVLGAAVDLSSDYRPRNRSDWEEVTRETERLVDFLKSERNMILGDSDAPDELVNKRGIDKLLKRAVSHLSYLYREKPGLSETKPRTEAAEQKEDHHQESQTQESKKGFIAWFDRQETGVKAALIAAIASFFGALATVIVAMIRRGA